jgi:DNA-binding SARP family transcriptional activator
VEYAVTDDTMQPRIGILGPLEVTVGSTRLELTARRQRAVLGMLALRAGRTVSVGQLVDGLWGDAPPESAIRTLHSYVAHLRRALAEHGVRDVLLTREPGYLIDLPAGAVDALHCAELVRAGRALLTAGDLPAALERLESALALWRGDELADCGVTGWAAAEGARLAQTRLSVTEDALAIRVALGDHRAAAPSTAPVGRATRSPPTSGRAGCSSTSLGSTRGRG